ncbi:MAG: alanine racemase [Bacteroidota bacterium]|nr:alanine racemase [Bacteroidota bacterium]
MVLDQVTHPTLLVDPSRTKANIRKLAEKSIAQKLTLRPHFKTHQSHTIGSWFRDEGITKITVSSVGMAAFFAMNGWDDITIAFPFNVRQIEQINKLLETAKLGLIVEHYDTVDFLGQNISDEVGIWIKIDVGTHRTGIAPENTGMVEHILDRLKQYPRLRFLGFLGHAGHTYQTHTLQEVIRITDYSIANLVRLKEIYQNDFPGILISLGDTPSTSMLDDFKGVDELRPGNFVFYDLQQLEIGSCAENEIAVAMACPVVAVHPERNQWIVYGGGIHFAKDFMVFKDGSKCFGRFVHFEHGIWTTHDLISNPFLISISQEHGVVQCSDQTFAFCKPGDIALFLPVHSCMTADCMGGYLSTDGDKIDHYREHLWPL